jgi:2-succinyl-5-enolpyruvyl-6-hydroxy-3-cyclohexene-1-carboxylate synthase
VADGGNAVRDANQEFAAALLDELSRAGVAHVCLCPGSRSTPLVVAAARTTGLTLHAQLDERSAAFFGLGLARASRQPVALICTSGTAAANFLPAVIEAHYARVPLVVLTADRPPELREWGAGQTIDQVRLYGSHVRLFVEAPVPAPGVRLSAYARALASRAVATAVGLPAGPVHLNLPFREPLEPTAAALSLPPAAASPALPGRRSPAYLAVERPERRPFPELLKRLAAALAGEPRGVLVAGPTDRDPGLATQAARLARTLGWPLLAEPTSQLRCGLHVRSAPIVAHYDAFLRDVEFARMHTPGVVFRIGDTPTSKPLRQWLEAAGAAQHFFVDPDGAWHDPTHRGGESLQVDPALLCAGLADALAHHAPGQDAVDWGESFRAADAACARVFDEVLAREPRLLAPAVVRALAAALPDGASLFVSSSMPVRDVDTFWPAADRRLRVLCNRGANGIDGVVSSSLGASLAGEGPTALLTGDLAFLHDVGGLFAARRLSSSCTLLVLNDDGGGIFSFLPIAEQGESVSFRELFTLPHGLNCAPAAALYGLGYVHVCDAEGLWRALAASIGAPGVRVIEVSIAGEANVALHRTIWRAVSEALPREEIAR